MDKEQRTDRIMDLLRSKGLRECPICGEGPFGVGPELLLINPAKVDAEESSLGGSMVVPVMCANCGHMMFFGRGIISE